MKELILTIAFAALAATLSIKKPENHLLNDVPVWIPVADNEPEYNATSDVIFRLFTRKNPTEPQIISFENITSLNNSHFNAAHSTRFIIHGWRNNGDSKIYSLITPAYLDRGEFNVITVDWSAAAGTPNYLLARNRIYETGQHVARFIDWVNHVTDTPFKSIFVVGHSLGGHIAGIVGKHVTRGRLQAIFALDPAKPGFAMDRPAERVTSTDASYVEVIHTNAGNFGFDHPIGIADFYPNWGTSQPECKNEVCKFTGCCSHSSAYEYFAESINTPDRFVSTKCASYNEIINKNCTTNGLTSKMGEKQNGFASGVYFVETNAALKIKAWSILVIFVSMHFFV